MRSRSTPVRALVLLLLPAATALSQNQPVVIDPLKELAASELPDIYTEHPRIFLRPQRLRLLRRERERRSLRWQQFETLVAGKAPMVEPGLSHALYYQISGDVEFAKSAVAYANSKAADLRQMALVFDWCQPAMTQPQIQALGARISQALAIAPKDQTVTTARNRMLAAVAIAGVNGEAARNELRRWVSDWWAKQIVPALRSGQEAISRHEYYALFELLNAVRDNTNLELRESANMFFRGLSAYQLIAYYPALFPSPENDYHIPARKGAEEPDIRRAVLARAAEFAMVAYDTNAQESQILQGWLMHDNFMMRSTFGAPYEFLWANPYQPGLSYYLVPLTVHDPLYGRLFIRSGWDDAAAWFGIVEGEYQLFQEGRVTVLNPQLNAAPVQLPQATVLFGHNQSRFEVETEDKEEAVFVVGLKPRTAYEVEVTDEELRELFSDTGGILSLEFPAKQKIRFRLRPSPAAVAGKPPQPKAHQ